MTRQTKAEINNEIARLVEKKTQQKSQAKELAKILTRKYKKISSRWGKWYEIRKLVDKLKTLEPPHEWKLLKDEFERKNQEKRQVFVLTRSQADKMRNPGPDDYKDPLVRRVIRVLYQTGRRISEILETPFKVREGSLYYVPFKKGSETYEKINSLIDTTPQEVYDEIMDIRKGITIKSNFIKKLSRQLKQTIGDDMYPHKIRNLYAEDLIQRNNLKQGQTTPFIQSILNHSTTASAHRYDYLKVVETPDVGPIETPEEIPDPPIEVVEEKTPEPPVEVDETPEEKTPEPPVDIDSEYLRPSLDFPEKMVCLRCRVLLNTNKKTLTRHLKGLKHRHS